MLIIEKLIKTTILIMLYRDHDKKKYVEFGTSDGGLAARWLSSKTHHPSPTVAESSSDKFSTIFRSAIIIYKVIMLRQCTIVIR